MLSNFDPATRAMIFATDGSVESRSTINPDRNNFGPRLGFAYTVTPRTVVRGGYGISYVHFSRAGGGELLPINGPQVINAVVVQSNPATPPSRRTEQGYPADFTDPSPFNPLAANITYMPKDYHSSPVQSWYVSVQRELWSNVLLDVAYVGNRADDLLLFANFNQALPNNAAGTIPLAGPPADSGLRRHHLRVQRRQVALQGAPGQGRLAPQARPVDAELADALADRRTTARGPSRTRTATIRRRRTSTTSMPTSACPGTTSRTTARRAFRGTLPFGAELVDRW